MLNDNLYTIQITDSGADELKAEIHLDAAHEVFKGHFPDVPVLPGVAMLQMVKDTIESNQKTKLFFQIASSIKFLDFVNPTITRQLFLEIKFKEKTSDQISIQAQLKSDQAVHLKLQATYQILS